MIHYSRPILFQCSGKAILVPTHALQDIESLGSGPWIRVTLLLHGRFLYWDVVNDSPIWPTGWPATLCYPDCNHGNHSGVVCGMSYSRKDLWGI